MGIVGTTVTTCQEYLERSIRAAARGMEICASDPMKSAQHKATKRAYEDALRTFKNFGAVKTKEERWN